MKRIVKVKSIFINFLLICVSISCVYPLVWLVSNSFKNNAEILKRGNLLQVLLPGSAGLDNYYRVFIEGGFGVYIFNTLMYTVVSVLLGIIVGVMAAFVLSFYRFPLKNFLYAGIVIFMMIPMPGIFIPQYLVISRLHLMNSRLGLILPFAAGLLPLTVFIVKGFMDGFKAEIVEAATIDGCNKWSMCWRIVVPMTMPAIATVSVLHVRAVWNAWILPALIITDSKLHTIQSGLMKFEGEHFTDYALIMTALVISIIPLFALFLLLQKKVIQGIGSGALKG